MPLRSSLAEGLLQLYCMTAGRVDSRVLIVRPSLGCSLTPITPPGNDEGDQLKQAITC